MSKMNASNLRETAMSAFEIISFHPGITEDELILKLDTDKADALSEALDVLVEEGLVAENGRALSPSPFEGHLLLELGRTGCSACGFDLSGNKIVRSGITEYGMDFFENFLSAELSALKEMLTPSGVNHFLTVSVVYSGHSPFSLTLHNPLTVRANLIEARRRIRAELSPRSVSFFSADSLYASAALKTLPSVERAVYVSIRNDGFLIARKQRSSVSAPVPIRSAYGTEMKKVLLDCSGSKEMGLETARALYNLFVVLSPDHIVFDTDTYTFPEFDPEEVILALQNSFSVDKNKLPGWSRFYRDRSVLHGEAVREASEKLIRKIADSSCGNDNR